MITAGMVSYGVGFLTGVAIFALFVLALNLQFGFTGLLNFGHVAFMAVGGYAMVVLTVRYDWPFLAAVAAALILATFFSLFIGAAALRLREDYLAIVTIGFAEIVRLTINNEVWLTRGPQGMFGFPIPFAGYGFSPIGNRIALLLLSLVILVAIFILLEYLTRSPWGRVLKAIREDEEVAFMLGKNIRSFKIQSLALGSAIAGMAGVLAAFFLRFISPGQFEAIKTFEGWMMMVLGGSGSNWGSVLGAFMFRLLFSGTRQYDVGALLGITSTQVAASRQILVGLVLILLMMYRPQGILGKKEELTLER